MFVFVERQSQMLEYLHFNSLETFDWSTFKQNKCTRQRKYIEMNNTFGFGTFR